VTSDDIENIVIAYEPIWAISTFNGEPAKPDDMQKAMDFIRFQIKELYGDSRPPRLSASCMAAA
jgi:triosephosphate isomerase